MITRQLLNRLRKVEQRIFPKRDESMVTLEEACRVIWQHDKEKFRKMTIDECSGLRYFIPQFEREDLLEKR
jgi:hypothetical protein